MSSSKKGERFENFVRQIEETTLPSGFVITPRKCIYNEGVQLAEFDIDIEGIVNGTKFKWLIECRDRPSEGPAPVGWIEQLVGRKFIHKYSKVTAVSTTGFSAGAAQIAQKGNVELKKTREVTYEEVKSWMRSSTLTLMDPIGTLLECKMFIDEKYIEKAIEAGLDIETELDNESLLFKNIKTSEKQNFLDLFNTTLNNRFMSDPTLDYFQENNLPQDFRITGETNNDWEIQNRKMNIPVRKILFSARTTSIKKTEVPVSKILNYSVNDGAELLSQSACFSLENNSNEIDINIHHKPTTNTKKKINLTIKKISKKKNVSGRKKQDKRPEWSSVDDLDQ